MIVGLVSSILMLPLAPVTGLAWVADRLREMADQELNDPVALRRQLAEAEDARVAGYLSDSEYAVIEGAIVERLLQNSGVTGGMS